MAALRPALLGGDGDHLQIVGDDRILGIECARLAQVGERRRGVAAQQVGIAEIVVVLGRAAGEPVQGRIDAVGEVEATQAIIRRGEPDIAFRIVGHEFDIALVERGGIAEIADAEMGARLGQGAGGIVAADIGHDGDLLRAVAEGAKGVVAGGTAPGKRQCDHGQDEQAAAERSDPATLHVRSLET